LQRDNGGGKTKSIDTNAIKLQALTIYVLENRGGKGAGRSGHPVIHIKPGGWGDRGLGKVCTKNARKSASKQKVRIGKLKIDNIKLSRHRLVGGESGRAICFCMWLSLFYHIHIKARRKNKK